MHINFNSLTGKDPISNIYIVVTANFRVHGGLTLKQFKKFMPIRPISILFGYIGGYIHNYLSNINGGSFFVPIIDILEMMDSGEGAIHFQFEEGIYYNKYNSILESDEFNQGGGI